LQFTAAPGYGDALLLPPLRRSRPSPVIQCRAAPPPRAGWMRGRAGGGARRGAPGAHRTRGFRAHEHVRLWCSGRQQAAALVSLSGGRAGGPEACVGGGRDRWGIHLPCPPSARAIEAGPGASSSSVGGRGQAWQRRRAKACFGDRSRPHSPGIVGPLGDSTCSARTLSWAWGCCEGGAAGCAPRQGSGAARRRNGRMHPTCGINGLDTESHRCVGQACGGGREHGGKRQCSPGGAPLGGRARAGRGVEGGPGAAKTRAANRGVRAAGGQSKQAAAAAAAGRQAVPAPGSSRRRDGRAQCVPTRRRREVARGVKAPASGGGSAWGWPARSGRGEGGRERAAPIKEAARRGGAAWPVPGEI
jgi:hypothetical protein